MSGKMLLVAPEYDYFPNPKGIVLWIDWLVIRESWITITKEDTAANVPDDFLRIILSALDLPVDADLPQHDAMASRLEHFPSLVAKMDSIILEAELLPYNEACRGQGRGPGIEEFWNLSRIRGNE